MSKQELDCKVIEDLYPVYKDGLCSAETKQRVEAHLASCAACRKLYEDFPAKLPDADPPDVTKALQKYRRKKRVRRIFTALGTLLLALLLTAADILCYAGGYIPLIGRLRAESRLSAYSGHKVRCTFDMYNGNYKGGGMLYYLKDDLILDPSVSESVRLAMDAAYQPYCEELKAEGLLPTEELSAYTAIDGADFGQQFHSVFWIVWDASETDDAEAMKRMALLTDRLTKALPDYQITGIHFWYNTLSGCYECRVPHENKQPLNAQAVQAGTEKAERLSEEYIQWQEKGGRELPFSMAQ